jgi:AcrR family transcriptional regulator
MGIQERKRSQREELRRRVLATAEGLFVADGYANVSMRKIAAAIEYSPTTLYRLFASKAEIMETLIAEGYLGVYQRYQEVIARQAEDPLVTLRDIIRAYVEFALANPRHYELWFSTSQIELVDGRLYMRHGQLVFKVFSVWLEHIEECKRRGLQGALDTMATFQLIWGAVHGLISLRIRHRGFPWLPLAQHLDALFEHLERSLLGRGSASGQPGGAGNGSTLSQPHEGQVEAGAVRHRARQVRTRSGSMASKV